MGTFEKRGKFWRAKIRRRGVPEQTRTFDNEALAQKWARGFEAEIDNGIAVDQRGCPH